MFYSFINFQKKLGVSFFLTLGVLASCHRASAMDEEAVDRKVQAHALYKAFQECDKAKCVKPLRGLFINGLRFKLLNLASEQGSEEAKQELAQRYKVAKDALASFNQDPSLENFANVMSNALAKCPAHTLDDRFIKPEEDFHFELAEFCLRAFYSKSIIDQAFLSDYEMYFETMYNKLREGSLWVRSIVHLHLHAEHKENWDRPYRTPSYFLTFQGIKKEKFFYLVRQAGLQYAVCTGKTGQQFFEQAVEEGCVDSLFSLAHIALGKAGNAYIQPDYPKAIDYLTRLANRGSATACSQLAQLLKYGKNEKGEEDGPQDLEKSEYFFQLKDSIDQVWEELKVEWGK